MSSSPIVLDFRDAIDRADHNQHGFLATNPVLDDAATLMEGMSMAAIVRNVDLTTYEGRQWTERLARIALEMAGSRLKETGPRTVPDADSLLDSVLERCAARGIPARRLPGFIMLDRTVTTPAWGRDGDAKLVLGIDIDCGRWVIAPGQPSHTSSTLTGTCDVPGIDAMLDLVIAINTGERPGAW